MIALWCDPWQVHALPCGCAARQPDGSQTWVPLRPCRAHADLIAWALVLRTLPELGGSVFEPLPPPMFAPYEQEVRCRCCGRLVSARPCDCAPMVCLCAGSRHVQSEHCPAHCQSDNAPACCGTGVVCAGPHDDDADGHPEPDDDITW